MTHATHGPNEFFAVTINSYYGSSVYRVKDIDKDGRASVTKIALRGRSRHPIGHRLRGEMVAICRGGLILYVPERASHDFPTHPGHERRIEHVHHEHRIGNTSDIVALFKTEEEARQCLKHHDLERCDKRWFEKTKEVICEIGDRHPVFYVAKELWLAITPRHHRR